MLRAASARASIAAALLFAAGSTNAALFSFASDSADHAWTFTGNGATFTQATGVNDPIVLMIDDNNGVLPSLQFSCRFTATTTLSFAGDVIVGGAVNHNYAANGSFGFVDVATNILILSGSYTGQVFTAQGQTNSWFGTGNLQGNSNTGTKTLTWGGTTLAGYGLTANTTYAGQFGFTLDTINTSGAIPYGGQSPGVALNTTTHFPTATWFSEASFVATNAVPAPAGLSLLGLAGIAAARRRRR